jgi:site-specific DNA-methyltransferase (adenine-specific)
MTPDKIYTGKSTIRMYNADCMELLESGKRWDLAIVDPPYGIGINTNMGRRKGDKQSSYHKFVGGDKSIPDKSYFDNILKRSTNQIIWGGNYMTEYLRPSSCWLLWDKGFSEDVTFAQFELAWTSFPSSAKKFDKNPNQLHRIHPTQKPVKLYKWLLKNYAKPGDTILDTHGGSMSIAIACWDMGFDLDICELDSDYFNDAVKRFEQHITQTNLFNP